LKAKHQLRSVDKTALCILLLAKMGITTEGVPLVEARKSYVVSYKSPLPDEGSQALSELCGVVSVQNMERPWPIGPL
jgi:hypothetical protein